MRNQFQGVLQRTAVFYCLIALCTSQAAASVPGTADVEINGVKSELSGFCNTNEVVLQFWTDGNGAPAQRDLNDDGAYLDIMLHSGMSNMHGGGGKVPVVTLSLIHFRLLDDSWHAIGQSESVQIAVRLQSASHSRSRSQPARSQHECLSVVAIAIGKRAGLL